MAAFRRHVYMCLTFTELRNMDQKLHQLRWSAKFMSADTQGDQLLSSVGYGCDPHR